MNKIVSCIAALAFLSMSDLTLADQPNVSISGIVDGASVPAETSQAKKLDREVRIPNAIPLKGNSNTPSRERAKQRKSNHMGN